MKLVIVPKNTTKDIFKQIFICADLTHFLRTAYFRLSRDRIFYTVKESMSLYQTMATILPYSQHSAVLAAKLTACHNIINTKAGQTFNLM